MTYDEAVRAADMFTAAMAEAGYPLRKPAQVDYEGDGQWGYWWNVTPDRHVEDKARLLVAHSLGHLACCTRCWFENNCKQADACAHGHCPYDHEVATDA